MQTPREIVLRALEFRHPERIPRNFFCLPQARRRYPNEVEALYRDFPSDIVFAPPPYRESSRSHGDPYDAGSSVDEWGCVFENFQEGIFGEVKHPQITDISDWRRVSPPYEILPPKAEMEAAAGQVNAFCHATDRFVFGGCCPRIWERYQFLRGSEEALIDLGLYSDGMVELLERIWEFYRTELEFWVQTDIDGVIFMDDWGSQTALLIRPEQWRSLFKPKYRAICELLHRHGKKAFFHSDGNIIEVLPDLVEIGVDALNSQIFCMDMTQVAAIAKGRLTFWGELDRQHALCGTPEDGVKAVQLLARHCHDPAGGFFAQFEFGLGTRPETARAALEAFACL